MAYDLYIYGQEAWDDLVRRDLDVVIDPLVLRLGQYFLEGRPPDDTLAESRWNAIEQDLGSLIAFFDLIVLQKQFPAFNYQDTFDSGPDIGDPLSEVINTAGDKVLFHVDVEHHMYRLAKDAALKQLRNGIESGGIVSAQVARDILRTTQELSYEWRPSLEGLENELRNDDEATVARFLLGQLVFTGYAQQTGAPHILGPLRSRLMAAIGLGSSKAGPEMEVAIYEELARRSRDAGVTWRAADQPWTPSFLPFLVQQHRDSKHRSGPDVLLHRAKELRETRAVETYREIRKNLSSEGNATAGARATLTHAADGVARSLDATRRKLEVLRQTSVQLLPESAGAGVGALVGGFIDVAGGGDHYLGAAVGAAMGAATGLIAKDAATLAQDGLYGWYLEGVTRLSARKMLTRAMIADLAGQENLGNELRLIWETPRRTALGT